MTRSCSDMNLTDRLQHLVRVISSERFLERKGLGNEVPFFICAFDPSESTEMSRLQKQLINHLLEKRVTVLEVSLYDLAIELLEAEGLLEQILQNEAEWSKDELQELLQNSLDAEAYLVPAIQQRMNTAEFDVLFISGVGEVFPYIRSHNVLNNLQRVAKEKPTLMFFPGEYTQSLELGASLDLFGKIRNDKYYRAFDIAHFEV
jgi:hypothetical protein